MDKEKKLVDSIKSIIKDENIEELCGSKYISVEITVDEISNQNEIEQSFKEYIKEKNNDNLDNYKVEEIKYWIDDLRDIIRYTKETEMNIQNIKRINKLIQCLKNNKVKAYRLINSKTDNGEKHEYIYLTDSVTGTIRCYEKEDERFIISFNGYD